MCRVLKVLVVAPAERHLDLRRALSSLDYEIAATVTPAEAGGPSADVALVVDPAPGLIAALRERGMKVVAVAGDTDGADLVLDDVGEFRERVWELFRAR